MINCDNGALFDPGIGNLFVHFSDVAYQLDYELKQIKSFHTKRSQYIASQKKLYEYFYNNIAFYNGCLMWALYIAKAFEEDKKLLNNPFYGQNPEKYDFYDELNFIISYFDKFEKNSKYYFNKSADIDPKYKKIAETYKQFLELNNNFVNTQTTKEIKIPKNIIEFNTQKGEEIITLLDMAINNNNLSVLQEFQILK